MIVTCSVLPKAALGEAFWLATRHATLPGLGLLGRLPGLARVARARRDLGTLLSGRFFVTRPRVRAEIPGEHPTRFSTYTHIRRLLKRAGNRSLAACHSAKQIYDKMRISREPRLVAFRKPGHGRHGGRNAASHPQGPGGSSFHLPPATCEVLTLHQVFGSD